MKKPETYYIDYENVCEKGLEGIELLEKEDHVYIYYSTDCKMHLSLVEKIMNAKCQVHFIKLPRSIKEKNIKNALDILILADAYKAKQHPNVIISKDKGYDECFKEFDKDGSKCTRYESIGIPFGINSEKKETEIDISSIENSFSKELSEYKEYKEITIQLIQGSSSKEELGRKLFKAIRNESAGKIMKGLRPYLIY